MRKRHRPAALPLVLGVFAVVVGLTIVMGATAATAEHTAVLANSVALQDSTGEDPNALDIGLVTVSNDNAGLVTFDVKFVNGSLNYSTDSFYVVMNTDRNESTGSPNTYGGDYLIAWWGQSALLKWNGSDWDLAPMTTLVTMSQSGEMIVKVHPSELGNVTGFDFYVKTYRPDPNDPEGEYSDWAPNMGMWSYDVKLAPTLTATPVACKPDPPRAGKAMVAQMTVTVTRGGKVEPLPASATVTSTATIAGKKVVGTVMPLSGSKVAVRWVVPKTAAGKLMRGKITVTLEGVSVTQAFVDRVK